MNVNDFSVVFNSELKTRGINERQLEVVTSTDSLKDENTVMKNVSNLIKTVLFVKYLH